MNYIELEKETGCTFKEENGIIHVYKDGKPLHLMWDKNTTKEMESKFDGIDFDSEIKNLIIKMIKIGVY